MTSIKKILSLLLVIISCAACAPYLYIPSGINMPLMSRKGELKVNVTYGSDGYGLQGAYAYDSCHLVVVNGACSYPGFGPDYIALNIKAEAGIGYFKKKQNTRFDFIGGAGYGLGRGTGYLWLIGDDQNFRSINGQFVNLFAQADCGWVYKDFECGLGLRVSGLGTFGTFECEQWEGNDGFNQHMFNDYKTNINNISCLIEPGFMMAVGGKHCKLTWAFGFSFVEGPDTGLPPISMYQEAYMTVGLRADLFVKK